MNTYNISLNGKEIKLKSFYNFSLLEKADGYRFCLKTSLGIVTCKVYVNLSKNYLTVKIEKKSVWKGNFEKEERNIIDFSRKNLKDEGGLKSVDGIINHYGQKVAKKVNENINKKESKKEKEEPDLEELKDKLEKYMSQ